MSGKQILSWQLKKRIIIKAKIKSCVEEQYQNRKTSKQKITQKIKYKT